MFQPQYDVNHGCVNAPRPHHILSCSLSRILKHGKAITMTANRAVRFSRQEQGLA